MELNFKLYDSSEKLEHLKPLIATPLLDTYWYFAAERQNILFRRLKRSNYRWTDDPILQEYKFTNAYRVADRASQFLIRNVIYRDDLPSADEEVIFRIFLFKLFNKIETWEYLEDCLGKLTLSNFSFTAYDNALTRAMDSGQKIYSAAYIMHPGSNVFGNKRKHQNHLMLLEQMFSTNIVQKLKSCGSMQEGFEVLFSYPLIGDFLAYQYITDINYSEVVDFSETEFVVPGPGALDGISKCFYDLGGLNEPELIKFMCDIQDDEFTRLGIDFKNLWGRKLQYIDCQNLFCEISKYSRISHPHLVGKSNRTRIKQKFAPHESLISFWFPPKWGINENVTTTGAHYGS